MPTSTPPGEGKPSTKNHPTDATAETTTATDVEKQGQDPDEEQAQQDVDSLSAFKALGFLDRFLAVWIFLAMLVGILLGNFVHDVGPALQKGTFVEVSVPIGKLVMDDDFTRDGGLCISFFVGRVKSS